MIGSYFLLGDLVFFVNRFYFTIDKLLYFMGRIKMLFYFNTKIFIKFPEHVTTFNG